MAETIGIDREGFRPSYRPEKRQGFDPEMKRMGIVAAGLGGLLALFAGGALLLRPGHHTVPVIEADPGPVRVKPDNPGGMQVSGADFGATPGQGPHLAPAAEQPELNALHAQLRTMQKQIARQAAENAEALKAAHLAQLAAAQPRPPLSAIAPAVPIERASATALVRVPASALAHSPSAVALAGPRAVVPAADDAAGTGVQFAAFTDEPAARAEWDALVKRTPEMLGGRKPEISKADAGGRIMWRLRTGGFGSVAEAADFCAKMRAKGTVCSIAAF